MSKVALFFLAVLMVVAGSTALVLGFRALNNTDPVPSGSSSVRELPTEPLESFQLTDQSGQEFDSESLKGQLWISSFFFASCPATCRRQNEAIASLQQQFGDRGVKFVAISVDPASDTPGVLSTYAQSFAADPRQWFFLTDTSGRIDYIRRVGQDLFKVPVTTQGHADTLILVGRDGAIVDYYNWKKPERIMELEQEIERRLNQPPEIPAAEAEQGEAASDSGKGAEAAPPPTASLSEESATP